jgi:hypothetical protein
VGCLKEIKNQTGAKVTVHKNEINLVEKKLKESIQVMESPFQLKD